MKKISSKITLTYVLLTLAVIVSVDILTSVKIESFLKQRIVNDLNRQSDVVSYTLRKESTLSLADLHKQMKAVGELVRMRITVINGQGVVLLDSEVPFEETGTLGNHLDRPEIQHRDASRI